VQHALNGVYAATFQSGQGKGSGVVVIDGGRLHGGDTSFYYKGKFLPDDNKKLSAFVEVRRHSPTLSSIFGPLESFRLRLSGVFETGAFDLSDHIEEQPGALVIIKLNKVSPLVDEE
jgi:hypothetical protein